MGDFTVVYAATATLAELLRTHVTDSIEPQVNGIPVDLRSPRQMRDDNNAQGLSLWLHQARRDPDLTNHPADRPAPDQRSRRSVPLELGYLVTPVNTDPEICQVLLGRVVQVFNDWSRLRGPDLRSTLAGTDEELRIHLDTELLLDHTRIWHALHLPYRLSMPYLVQYVTVESGRPPTQAPPVVRRDAGYGQIVGVAR